MVKTSSQIGRWRLRRVALTLLLGVGAVAAVATGTTAGTAGAAASAITYQNNGSQPGPLPSLYNGQSASDGWAVAVSATQVFNVSHHAPTLQVACHNQSDGSDCWGGVKTVTGAGATFATPLGAGLYLDQASGHLYAYAIRTTDVTAGVVCIDTSLPATATGPQMFCGFTALDSIPGDVYYVPPVTPGAPVTTGLSAPVLVGTSWYSFNEYAGSTSGNRNKLLCFNVVTANPCSAQPYTVALGTQTVAAFTQPTPIGASGTAAGSQLYLQIVGTTADLLSCIATSTNTPCTGSWPVTLNAPAITPYATGAPVPLLDTSGTPIGTCMATASMPCFTSSGATTATPPGMATAIGSHLANLPNQALEQATGAAAIVNASVYVPVSQTNTVTCYNFATQSACAGFPKVLQGMLLLYTLNPDPDRPTCLWANANSGVGQIQNFDAVGGGSCARGPLRIQSNTLVNPSPTCVPTAFATLQITAPARSAYTSASVSFADPQGNAIAVPAQGVDAFGSVNLAGLALQTHAPYPQFVVTFAGLSSTPTTISYRLTWSGSTYATQCISNGQTVSSAPGYWMVASDGGIFNYGNAGFYGSAGALSLNKPIVGMASLPCRCGYYLVASDGGIFSYGYARFFGSTGAIALNKPIVGMAVTPTGLGYWLVASDGGIFAYGDARFYGSTGAIALNKPIVGMAATQDGAGYWLVASDGGIFAFGDAAFYGSTGAIALNKPIVGMAANPNGGGYWMVASDGGIFAFGNAGFYGSTGALRLNKPIVGMAASPLGRGYWLVASDGGIFSFGDAGFAGSAGALHLNKPIVAMTA
jgi:hypothetical protein